MREIEREEVTEEGPPDGLPKSFWLWFRFLSLMQVDESRSHRLCNNEKNPWHLDLRV